jgi:membrane fusion protein, adhesin transport system
MTENRDEQLKDFNRHYIPRGQMKHLTREAVLEELGPSRLAVTTLLLILAFISFAVGWSYFVPVTTAAKTIGKVVPSGNQRVVQHLEGGIVREILVQDGDHVSPGQPLIRFDPTQRKAELDQIKARETSLRIKEIRLRAQINGADPDFGDLAARYPVLVEEALITLQATRERIAGQQSVLQSKIEQRRSTVSIYRKQALNLKSQLKLVREAVEMREKLFKSGHGSRVNVISASLELSRVEGGLSDAETSASQAEVGIEEARNELNELIVTERDNALQSLSGVLGELAEVNENLTRLQDRVDRLVVNAPINGIVLGLTVNTQGAVVEPAAVLMTIIPVDERLVVETEIAPKDIGHVELGQVTKVAVNGFDQRRYGTVLGKLMRLSPTTVLNDKGEPYFKGRIELDDFVIRADGEKTYPIMPGMTVTADIITGQQSLLQYLTGPIYNALSSSFAER